MAPAFPMPGCPARHRTGTRDSAQKAAGDEERATFEPRSISVLTLAREGIAEITTFLGPWAASALRARGPDRALAERWISDTRRIPTDRAANPPPATPLTRRRRDAMTDHNVVDRTEFDAAREKLIEREKEHTRKADELARPRRAFRRPLTASRLPLHVRTDL